MDEDDGVMIVAMAMTSAVLRRISEIVRKWAGFQWGLREVAMLNNTTQCGTTSAVSKRAQVRAA